MSQNRGAYIPEAKGTPLKVDFAPDHKPGAGEVLIKNSATAINPVDWKIQDHGIFVQEYPHICGEDVAGEVVEVGEGVTNFTKGERVIGMPHHLTSGDNKHGGFQLYTVCSAKLVSKIPDSLSYEQASVLPLALTTAAMGLYAQKHMGLRPLPTLNPKPSGKTVLVWGGASSVGSAAIQLAAASGASVVATASKRNFDFVKSLGAHAVFDYNSPSVVEDVVKALREGEFAGAYDAISAGSAIEGWTAVMKRMGSGPVVTVLPVELPGDYPSESKVAGCMAPELLGEDEVADAVWGKYVPEALAKGVLQAKPDALVVGHGLEKVQDAWDRQKQGVSAAKIVVTL